MGDLGDKIGISPPDVPVYATLSWPFTHLLRLMNIGDASNSVVKREPCAPFSDLTTHI